MRFARPIHVLALAVKADEWRVKDDTRFDTYREDFEAGIRHMTNWLYNQPGVFPGGEIAPGHSRLGSWYPAGS